MSNDRDEFTACIQKNNGMLRIVDDCDECRKSEICRSWSDCDALSAEIETLAARVAALEGGGMECPEGQVCVNPEDVCQTGFVGVDPANSAVWCREVGGCPQPVCEDFTIACEPGQECECGTCEECPQAKCEDVGLTKCGEQCVDLTKDEDHCGSCWNFCSPGYLCRAGVCALSCQTGLTKCATQCVNTRTDEANCGSCARECDPGEICDMCLCQ